LNEALSRWNQAGHDDAAQDILPCCGSKAWAEAMASRRPFEDVNALLQFARDVWWNLEPADWLEAFRSHPRIGESRAVASASEKSREWSSQEQRQVAESDKGVKVTLSEANRKYEERFGRIFIVCATGKAPNEILGILQRRLRNDEATELRESAAEQQQITQIRLRKWLAG
jgi:2-oxo-4-hydroxy-4-carboxy-5-ureidoimidazoline decarboxylase